MVEKWKWYSWDITSYVVAEHAGDKIVSVVMTLHNDIPPWTTVRVYFRTFDSREITNEPILEITTIAPGIPEFGVNVAMITSVAAAVMFALKRLRK